MITIVTTHFNNSNYNNRGSHGRVSDINSRKRSSSRKVIFSGFKKEVKLIVHIAAMK